ncbi:MAG: RHS repeat domain-containing protein [Ethanoligenens sp.]
MKSYTDVNGNVIQYSYDVVGNLAALTYPDGKVVQYTYDAANQLKTVTDWSEPRNLLHLRRGGQCDTDQSPGRQCVD